MSGGHFDYNGTRIRDYLEQIAEDETVSVRFPGLSFVLGQLAQALYEIEHDIDWDFCGDAAITMSDVEFEKAAYNKLRAALYIEGENEL